MNNLNTIMEKHGDSSFYNFACDDKLEFVEFLFEKDLITDEQLAEYANTYSEQYTDFVIDTHENELREQSGEFDI